MSYHEGTYITSDHKTHAQIWDLSNQLYRSPKDFLAKNFVSMLPNVVFLEKGNIKVDEVHDVTPQIRDVTGQRKTYTYAFEALTY